MGYTHILFPTDMSQPSLSALGKAVELAQTFKAKLTLLHVVVSTASEHNVDWRDATKMWLGLADAQEIKDEKEALTTIAENLVPDDVTRNVEVLYGDAPEEIVALAEDEDVDLIVMATHGWTGWRRLVLGSVTDAVRRAAPCAVLSVPRPTNS